METLSEAGSLMYQQNEELDSLEKELIMIVEKIWWKNLKQKWLVGKNIFKSGKN